MPKKTADNDEQLELKKRARRRLVGAVVFVTVAAVLLPMVMDDEPMAPAGGIELHIPGQEKGYTPPPVALAPADKPEPALVAAPTPVEPTVPATDANQAEASSPLALPETKPAPAPVAPAASPAAKPAAPVAAAPEEGKRPHAVPERKADKPKNGQYVVLIGAFANQANVQGLQKKIGELGIRVYTEPLDTAQGKKTRVRVGPFPSREAAEKAAARLKKIGVNGVVAAKS